LALGQPKTVDDPVAVLKNRPVAFQRHADRDWRSEYQHAAFVVQQIFVEIEAGDLALAKGKQIRAGTVKNVSRADGAGI